MQQITDRLAVGDRAQPRIVAVDRLCPGGDRAAGGDLEHVGGEAAVGQAQVERRGAGIAGEVEVGDLGDFMLSGTASATAPSTIASSRMPFSS